MDVRAVRVRLGLRQEDLAALLNVHPVTVSAWERGRASPRPWHEALLAELATAPAGVGATARRLRFSHGPVRALYELLRHGHAAARLRSDHTYGAT